jgi:hypothetical protein
MHLTATAAVTDIAPADVPVIADHAGTNGSQVDPSSFPSFGDVLANASSGRDSGDSQPAGSGKAHTRKDDDAQPAGDAPAAPATPPPAALAAVVPMPVASTPSDLTPAKSASSGSDSGDSAGKIDASTNSALNSVSGTYQGSSSAVAGAMNRAWLDHSRGTTVSVSLGADSTTSTSQASALSTQSSGMQTPASGQASLDSDGPAAGALGPRSTDRNAPDPLGNISAEQRDSSSIGGAVASTVVAQDAAVQPLSHWLELANMRSVSVSSAQTGDGPSSTSATSARDVTTWAPAGGTYSQSNPGAVAADASASSNAPLPTPVAQVSVKDSAQSASIAFGTIEATSFSSSRMEGSAVFAGPDASGNASERQLNVAELIANATGVPAAKLNQTEGTAATPDTGTTSRDAALGSPLSGNATIAGQAAQLVGLATPPLVAALQSLSAVPASATGSGTASLTHLVATATKPDSTGKLGQSSTESQAGILPGASKATVAGGDTALAGSERSIVQADAGYRPDDIGVTQMPAKDGRAPSTTSDSPATGAQLSSTTAATSPKTSAEPEAGAIQRPTDTAFAAPSDGNDGAGALGASVSALAAPVTGSRDLPVPGAAQHVTAVRQPTAFGLQGDAGRPKAIGDATSPSGTAAPQASAARATFAASDDSRQSGDRGQKGGAKEHTTAVEHTAETGQSGPTAAVYQALAGGTAVATQQANSPARNDALDTQASLRPIVDGVIVRHAALRVTDSSSSFRVVLEPKALGQVIVNVVKGLDGLQVSLTPQRDDTGTLLHSHMAELMSSLNASSIGTVHATILSHDGSSVSSQSTSTANQAMSSQTTTGQGFSASSGQGQSGGQPRNGDGSYWAQRQAEPERVAQPSMQAARPIARAVSDNRVDIHA